MKKHLPKLIRKSIEVLIIASVAFAFDFLIYFISKDDSIWIGESIEIVGAILCGPIVGFISTLINCLLTDFLTYGSFDYVLLDLVEAVTVMLIAIIYRRFNKENNKFGIREIIVFNFVQILVNVVVLFLSTIPLYLLIYNLFLSDWTKADIISEVHYLANTTFSSCVSVALIGTALLGISLIIQRKIQEKGSFKEAIKSFFALTFVKKIYRNYSIQYTINVFIIVAFSMIDGIISSHLLGEDALAAVALMIPLVTTVTFFSTIIVTGCSNRCVTASGEGDYIRSKKLFTCGLIASLIIGPLQSLILFLIKDFYLGFYNASDSIMLYAEQYYDLYIFIPIVFTIKEFLDEMVASDGGLRLCLPGNIISFVGNIVAALLLTKSMGIGGIVLARIIGFAIFIAILSIHFFKKNNTLKIKMWFSFKDLFSFIKYSLTDNITPLCMALTSIMLTKAILLFLGPEYLIVNVVVSAMLEIYESLNGPSEASSFLIESYTGEKNLKGIKTVFKEALFATLILGMTISLLLIIWPDAITLLYDIGGTPIHDELIKCIRYASLGLIAGCLGGFLTDYYANIGKPFLSSLLSIFRVALFPILFCVTFCLLGGVVEVGRGLLLSQITAIIVFLGFVLTLYGFRNIPYLIEEDEEFNKVDMISFAYNEQGYEEVIDWLNTQLNNHQYDEVKLKEIDDITLSLFKTIEDSNKKKKVLGECVLSFANEPIIIFKDDGKIFEPKLNIDNLSHNIVLSHNYNTLSLA